MEDSNLQIMLVLALVIAAVVIILILLGNIRKAKIQTQLDEVAFRYNEIKSIAIPLKLNKARAVAKIDGSTATIDQYCVRYDNALKELDNISNMMAQAEDMLAGRKYNDVLEMIPIINEALGECEVEIKEIDEFLENFFEKEKTQQEYSMTLKEAYRELKAKVSANEPSLIFAIDGINEKLKQCEDLFSLSEDNMYANEYVKAKENLDEIKDKLYDLDWSVEELPKLIKEAKGTIPVLFDDAREQYAQAASKGLYLGHLGIETLFEEKQKEMQKNLALMEQVETAGIEENLEAIKNDLNGVLIALEEETKAYGQLRNSFDVLDKEVKEYENIYNYIDTVYKQEAKRYALEELKDTLPQEKERLDSFKSDYEKLKKKFENNMSAATALVKEADSFQANLEEVKTNLNNQKMSIDNTSSGESRAKSQVVKLQLVLNEINVKIQQFRLPSISNSYDDDLKKSYEYVEEIKRLLQEIPLRVAILNKTLDEAIDFIYQLYNNVNNVVGMAAMVENTIVFGNKFRSTYSDVDNELSKAEFAFFNGEYTEALSIALGSMKTLFPGGVDDELIENA